MVQPYPQRYLVAAARVDVVRLRVERLAPDGEWEPVLTRDHLVRTSDVMGDPGGLVSFEERTAREAGYRRADLAIVDSPVFA